MKHRQILALIVALVIGAIVVVATPTWRGKPYRIKRGLDLAGGVRIVYQPDLKKMPAGKKLPADFQNSSVRILGARAIGGLGVSEPLIQPKGSDQVVVELPDIRDQAEAIRVLGATAQMEFRHLYNVHYDNATRWRPSAGKYTMTVTQDAKGSDVFAFADAKGNKVTAEKILAESRLKLTGDDLKPVSRATKDPQTFGTVVSIEFTTGGKKKFADFTRANVNEILAIVLDGKILSAPTIRNAILGGRAQIEGKFTTEEAQRLAEFINAGVLPVPLEAAQVQSVEATLGQASVDKSVEAGIGGLIGVIIFMVLYYLLPGLLADIALAIYALLTIAAFKVLGVTMTLPGIAAYIVSIGMAVDANILIFERLKEELRTGKTLRAAIDTGFARAFTSIFDSNMCTLITCAILFNFGTGPIKGFAVILGLGVLISMFTAITGTRTLLHLITSAGFAQNPVLYGLRRQWVTGKTGRQMDIVGKMGLWFGISALVILPGLYFWVFQHGLKGGIDFTGGSLVQVEFKQPVISTSAIDEVLTKAGVPDSPVQRTKDNLKMVYIRTKDLSEEQYTRLTDGLKALDGTILISERVGPTISKELEGNAIKAVLLAALAIVLYLSVRFAIGGLANGFRFGVCAIVATLHDVILIIGVFAMLGYFFGWEIDVLFVTALLTVIGFSTHDTIVIFDRIRENLRHRVKGDAFDALVNRSILQSFARSINTSLTVVLTLVAMFLFGARNIQHFVLALLIGVITGTYSSIFNASQLLVLWQRMIDKQPAASKPLVDPTASRADRVRELKPVEGEAEGPDGDAEIGGVTKTDSAAKSSKAKAKKRRRRF
ncbi:MAG: protein translocase subunit SecD [Armatimonadetes bacterium]|nr:protein translocase subunit SecD [Armatimonadota bacterium]